MKNIKLFEEFNASKSLEGIDIEGLEADLEKAVNDTEIEEGIACLFEDMTEEEAKLYFEDLKKRKPSLMDKITKWFNKVGKNLKKEIRKSITERKRNIIKNRREKRMKYSPAVERRMKLAKVGKVLGGIAFAALYATLFKKIGLPQINREQQ
jgi:sulfur relay (sulfurtransferase) DsrC/TusE family protein